MTVQLIRHVADEEQTQDHHAAGQDQVKKDVEELDEALKYIREMRDTWKEVMKLAKVK